MISEVLADPAPPCPSLTTGESPGPLAAKQTHLH